MPAVADELPRTTYRQFVEDCALPGHEDTFESMADYLSMMGILYRVMNQALTDSCGITAMQYRILMRLHVREDSLRATDLAASLRVGASTISTAISKLVEAGAVARADESEDMRAIALRITPLGSVLVHRADLAVGEMLRSYWKSLTRTQLEAALKSSMNAVVIHRLSRMENGRCRLDTAFFDTIMISRTLTAHALQQRGMTVTEFRSLLALRNLGPGATSSQVASYLFLKSSDVTQALRSLERKGAILRTRKQGNRRAKEIELTGEGGRLLEELMPVVFDALHETCRSDEEAMEIHMSAARDLVRRKRARSEF